MKTRPRISSPNTVEEAAEVQMPAGMCISLPFLW